MLGALATSGNSQIELVLLALAIFLLLAKLCGTLCESIKVPSIVGELCAGIVVGNLYLLWPGIELWQAAVIHSEFLHIASELGVIFLLFVVGLETSLADMRRVGANALAVAAIGVVMPFVLGYTSGFFLPGLTLTNIECVFLGAALTATSVGITAKVLADSNALQSTEGQTILGAAVIDDILGLMILAVISALAHGDVLTWNVLAVILGKVLLFFVGALVAGRYLMRRVIRIPSQWRGSGVRQSIALVIMFFMAWAAAKMGLAAIVGAFTAGLLLEETYFEGYLEKRDISLHAIVLPLTNLFLPIFFVLMGMHIQLALMTSLPILLATVVLVIVAVVGKIVSGLGLPKSRGDRLTVGYGMIPRGEVGLVFAAVGLASGAISREFYGVIVLVVVLSTVIAPILLRARLQRRAGVKSL